MQARTPIPLALAVFAAVAASCSERPRPNQRPTIRLSPVEIAGAPAAGQLVDRDTTAEVAVAQRTAVTLRFGHAIEVRRVKVNGARDLDVRLDGLALGQASAAGWAAGDLAAPLTAQELTLTLEPRAPGAAVREIEVWGAGRDTAPADRLAVALRSQDPEAPPYEDVWALRAAQPAATLSPAGLAEGESCLRTRFPAADVRQARRAYLAYEANVLRSVVLQHAFNGDAPVDGTWLGSTRERRTVLDELDPERLRGGDELLLCLPPDAGGAVEVTGLRLLLFLDDGVRPFDRETERLLAGAVDGAVETATELPEGPSDFELQRAIDVERAEIRLGRVPAKLTGVSVLDRGAWREAAGSDLVETVSTLAVDGRASTLRLHVGGESASSASVAEVAITGSGVGPRVGSARIVLTYPPLRREGDRDVGERFGSRAYVSGWAESPAGAGAVEVDGARVDVNGAFSVPLERAPGESGDWAVAFRARFPDGSEVARTIHLDADRQSELLAADAATSATADQRFGLRNQTGSAAIDPETGGKARLGTDVSVEVPPGAVSAKTSIGITRKDHSAMPRLDAGMVNVTAPPHAAYRFTPKGQKFAKPVKVTLPYDPDLLPEGVAPEEIQTWYFDEAKDRWFTLPRRAVSREARQVESETTHFTFMINAVLVLPDHPAPTSFNPTSLKDLKAADPSAGIDLIEPPVGNAEGTARVSLPIRLPAARGAYQPALALAYDSGGGNGWVGVGWDVPVAKVTIDGRYGVPEYTGSERYLLSGEQLVPVDDPEGAGTTCADGSSRGHEYRARVERQFRRILRCGADPTSYWFEVTEKTGVLLVYGNTDNGRLTSYVPRVTDPPTYPPVYDVAEWYLQRVVDPNGNLTEYAYQHDSREPGDTLHGEDFRQLYLRSIRYSGTAQRTGPGALEGGSSGPYEVELRHQAGTRPDLVTSARNGFKTVTRRRLASIEVRLLSGFPAGTIRTYRLSYEIGDLGKSRLRAVEVLGTDGKVFHTHELGYENKAPDRDGVELFGEPKPWINERTDGALSGSQEWSAGFHGFVGLGLGFSKQSGTIGVGFGYSRRSSQTLASFVDLNGDGLPDRVFRSEGGASEIYFNQGPLRSLTARAPAWDPAASGTVALPLPGRMGAETGRSFDVGLQVFGGPFALNFGKSYGMSKSSDFMLDANGDGLVDMVNGGVVRFNQPRHADCGALSADECCRARGFCFLDSYPMQALEDLADSSKLLTTDGTVASANADLANALTPEDAVLEWTAPYVGRVDVSGTFAFDAPPAPGERRDGVRLRVYRYDPFDPEPAPTVLATIVKPPGDESASKLVIPDVEVSNGTILYFVLSTLSDFPMRDGEALSPLEAVRLRPVVTYTGVPASLRARQDSTGAPAYRFAAESDFVVAGDPESTMTMPRAGDVAFTLEMKKRRTNDSVRACVKYFAPDVARPSSPRCSPDDFHYEVFAPERTCSEASPCTVTRSRSGVGAGGTFYVRLETDLPVDPHAVTLEVRGGMTCVETRSGCIAPADEEEAKSLSFAALPHFPLHDAVVADSERWRPDGALPAAWDPPMNGTIHVGSVALFANRASPIHFGIRTADGVALKHTGNHSAEGVLRVEKGKTVFFDAHTEAAASLAPEFAGWDWDGWSGWGPWDDLHPYWSTCSRENVGIWHSYSCRPYWRFSCRFEGEDGSWRDCPGGLGRITTDRTVEGSPEGNRPVLAGGHRGWRYGAWQGRDHEPFQPWVFRSPEKEAQEEWSGTSAEVRKRQKDRMKSEQDAKRTRLRLLGLAVPNAAGTRLQPDQPGLRPDDPAFVTQDGNTYFAEGGIVHAGKKGESSSNAVRGPDGVTVVPLEFQIGELARTSTFEAFSAGVGVGFGPFSASGSMSTGFSQQKLDVTDMNGDGIIDVVAGAGVSGSGSLSSLADSGVTSHVRVTSPVTYATSRVVRMPGVPLLTYDVSGQVGLGASDPTRQFTAEGETRGVSGRLPSMTGGAGVGFSVGTTVQQLVDLNGDGLLDAVRRSQTRCASGLSVRLNMGTSFAAAEDCVEASATSFEPDPLSSGTRTEVDDPEDADSADGSSAAAGVLAMGALRKTNTVTVQGTVGADFAAVGYPLGGAVDQAEAYGAAVTWESSLTATNLALLDVTGDGLPDYVQKSNQGRDFVVRVNRGYGFTQPRTWRPAARWRDVTGTIRPIQPRHQVARGTGPAAAIIAAFLPEASHGIDPIEATGSHSALPSMSVSFNFAFPLLVIPSPPWIHIGGGLSYSPKKVSGFELGMQDIDGDGLVDHVLKSGENRPVWARLNQLGRANLLTRIERPLGGSIDLAYGARVGNTVDMPESRWVLSKVTLRDGRAAPGELGHDLATEYEYFDGRRDRIEREFLGFRRVVRKNPDASRVEQIFRNETILTKGLLEVERLVDRHDHVWMETVNTWSAPIQVRPPLADCMVDTPKIVNPYSYCGSYFAPLDQVEKRFYEDRPTPGIVARQRFQYNVLGDVAWLHDDGDVADPTDDLKAKIAYVSTDAAATALYSVSRPSTVEVWDASGALLRSRTATYDPAQGNLTYFRAEIGGGEYADTNLRWNLNGTLDWVEGPKNATGNGQRLKTSYGYDSVAQTHVTAITDSHGYVSTAEYDPRFGEATQTKDINGNVTTRRLDAFGRVERIAAPGHGLDAPTVRMVYAHDAPVPYAWTRNRVPRSLGDLRGSVDTVVVMDGLGRVIQTKRSAEIATSPTSKGAGWSVTGHQRYDLMGRVAQRGQAVAQFSARPEYVPGAPRNPTRFVYDVLGRVIETVEPDGSLTRMTFGFGSPSGSVVTRFKTVGTDAEGKSRAAYVDAGERIVAIEERIGGRTPTTHYQYNALGELTRVVDAAGNVTSVTYDKLGRRTAVESRDTGLTSFHLDPAGNLKKKVDANGQTISFTYDYDQLTRITYPANGALPNPRDVTYRYGTAADGDNAIGRVVEVTDEAGRELRTYGTLGELLSTTRVLRPVLPGDRERTFKTSFTWDTFGRMLTVSYPDGETLAYEYDAGGLLERATGRRPGPSGTVAEVYLRSLVYDEYGQRVRLELGNGVETTYGYDPLTRRLRSLTTTTPRQRTLQAITYGYDRVGNVTSMVNALDAPVGDRTGETTFEFAYDDLSRLTFAHGQARAGATTIDRFWGRYQYSDIHNMTSNSQVHEIVYGDPGAPPVVERPVRTNHDFEYDYSGDGPHRAKKVGDTFLVYDRNGNTVRECRDHGDPTCQISSDSLRRYVWTEENRLEQVIDGGGRNVTRFVYDAGGERILKLGRGGESITIGQFWSLKGRRAATKHIFAGDTRFASKLLPPPGWDDVPRGTVLASAGGSTQVGDGWPNDNGCDPSDYQPQKCPILPGGDPSVTYLHDDTKVRAETYYYHSDHLGSTSWVTDHDARVREHVEYFPFGEVWREPRPDADGAAAKGQRFLFTGKQLDEETGLYLFGARYYAPGRALWLSPDPAIADYLEPSGSAEGGGGRAELFRPMTFAAYHYGALNPLRFNDPTGRADNESIPGVSNFHFHKEYFVGEGGVTRQHLHLVESRTGRTVMHFDADTFAPIAREGVGSDVARLTKTEKEALAKLIAHKKPATLSRATYDALTKTRSGKTVVTRLLKKGLTRLATITVIWSAVGSGSAEAAVKEVVGEVTGVNLVVEVSLAAGQFAMDNADRTVIYKTLFSSFDRIAEQDRAVAGETGSSGEDEVDVLPPGDIPLE